MFKFKPVVAASRPDFDSRVQSTGQDERLNELEAIVAALSKSQATIEFKTDGTILTANENFLNALGYRLEEVVGRHHSMFVSPAFASSAEYRQFWDNLAQGRFQQAEYQRFGKGGKEIWIQASYNPIMGPDGRPVKVIKFATDVTAQKLQNADYEGQIAAIKKSQAVISFNMDGTIIDANDNFLNTLGYRLDDIRGRHHSMFMPQEDRETAEYRNFWQRLNNGEFQAGRFKRIGAGGKIVWIEASYNPIMDMNGKPFKVVKYASDLTERKAATDALSIAVAQMVEAMNRSVREVESMAQTIAAGAEQTNQQSSAVAASSEELSASINEISTQLVEAERVARMAVEESAGGERMMQELVSAAQSVGNVTQLINQIAGKTDLLALNATIEAARAGEAGRGFAVVASEVKALSGQTSKATDEIGTKIEGIQSSIGTAAAAIRKIGDVIGRISSIATSVAGAVEEQSVATREVSNNISGVQTAARDAGSSSAALLELAKDLAAQADGLNSKIGDFLKTL